MTDVASADHLFERKEPQVQAIYEKLLSAMQPFGDIIIAPKQTSIHLETTRAFAGVHPRKSHIHLEFRSDYPIDNPRIARRLQLSARRYEHTVKLNSESDIDDELLVWLKDAYELSK